MVATKLTVEEQQRVARGVVAIEFDAEALTEFVDWLNRNEILSEDGYPMTFAVRYFNPASATIDITVHR